MVENYSFVISLCHKGSVTTYTRTNVASVGSVFNNTRKVKVLSLPETIQEKIDVSSEGPSSGVSSSCIVSGSERTFTFRVSPRTVCANYCGLVCT